MKPARIILLLVALRRRRPRGLSGDARRRRSGADRDRHRVCRGAQDADPRRQGADRRRPSGSAPTTSNGRTGRKARCAPNMSPSPRCPTPSTETDRRRRALRVLPGRADPRGQAGPRRPGLPVRGAREGQARRLDRRVSAASGVGRLHRPQRPRRRRPDPRRPRPASQSEIILSNVKVLAIGQRLGETGHDRRPGRSRRLRAPKLFADQTIATLELDPGPGRDPHQRRHDRHAVAGAALGGRFQRSRAAACAASAAPTSRSA